MSETDVKTTSEVLENLDDFVPTSNADNIASADGNTKPSIFSRGKQADLSFVDEPEDNEDVIKDKENEGKEDKQEIIEENEVKEDKEEKEITKVDKKETAAILDDLDKDIRDKEQEEIVKEGKTKGTVISKVMNKLIEEKIFQPFDDEKPMDDYTQKDWLDLIKVNIDAKEAAIREQTPKEFFEALPPSMQYAAMHVANGATEDSLKPVFQALAQREEIRELDIENETHHELIARQYLQATDFGKGDNKVIDEQIAEWNETGLMEKKAKTFKPKLDKMQDEILEHKLAEQTKNQEIIQAQKDNYLQNMYNTLKPGELNGIKIDTKRQNMLWNELTNSSYNSISGKPTNLLGKLLEEYQYGEKPRYDLIAEATWMLSDPEDYKKHIRQQAVNEETEKTVKKIKTEGERKLKTTKTVNEEEDATRKVKKTGIPRPMKSIFSR